MSVRPHWRGPPSQAPHSEDAAKHAHPTTPGSASRKEPGVLQPLRTTVAQVESTLLLATAAFSTLVSSVGEVVPLRD